MYEDNLRVAVLLHKTPVKQVMNLSRWNTGSEQHYHVNFVLQICVSLSYRKNCIMMPLIWNFNILNIHLNFSFFPGIGNIKIIIVSKFKKFKNMLFQIKYLVLKIFSSFSCCIFLKFFLLSQKCNVNLGRENFSKTLN